MLTYQLHSNSVDILRVLVFLDKFTRHPKSGVFGCNYSTSYTNTYRVVPILC